MIQQVTAGMVKEVRERTGGGMLECKKALDEAKGDIEMAIDLLRKSGQIKAAKKGGRIAAEGRIVVLVNTEKNKGVILEINSETDFVARDTSFQKFADYLAESSLNQSVTSVEELMNLPYLGEKGKTNQIARDELVAKIGENIQVRRLAVIRSQHMVAHYVHNNRIGVLVELTRDENDLGRDLAMHIAASRPQSISAHDLPAGNIEREKAIYLEQALQSGKPQAIAEKMVTGRLDKYINEITLLGQPFIKDTDATIGAILKKADSEVLNFVRFEVGEGIEKNKTDFAKEVEEQLSGKR